MHCCRTVPIFITLIMLTGLLAASLHAEAQSSPSDSIDKFNTALLTSMKKAKGLGYEGRYKLLEPVVKNTFALDYMAEITLGQYWETLSKDQQELFKTLYTEWTIASYAGRFNGYNGERFAITSVSEPVRGIVSVVSTLKEPKGKDVVFTYRLRKIDSAWKIADIQVEGVSQLALTRSQFTSIMKKQGFDGLISMIKDKIKALSKGDDK